MALLEFFLPKKKKTASTAKERLQIIVAERRKAGSPDPSYLPQLKMDIFPHVQYFFFSQARRARHFYPFQNEA